MSENEAIKTQDEYAAKFYGQDIMLRKGSVNQNGATAVAAINGNGDAWSSIFFFDPVSGVLEHNMEGLEALVATYQKKSEGALSAVLFILDIVIWVIDFLVNIVKGFLGSFVGFGAVGILIVISLMFISFMVSITVFIYCSPILLLAIGLRMYRQNKAKNEVASLSNSALKLFG